VTSNLCEQVQATLDFRFDSRPAVAIYVGVDAQYKMQNAKQLIHILFIKAAVATISIPRYTPAFNLIINNLESIVINYHPSQTRQNARLQLPMRMRQGGRKRQCRQVRILRRRGLCYHCFTSQSTSERSRSSLFHYAEILSMNVILVGLGG
jgi:hypothetical protein